MGPYHRGLCALLSSFLLIGIVPTHTTNAADTRAPRRINTGEFRGWIGSIDEFVRSQIQIQAAIQQWETASRRLEAPSAFQRRNALQIYGSRFSPHEVSVAIDFHAPVTAVDLSKRFRWAVIRRTPKTVKLVGVPRDVVERLFFKRFELTLDAKTYLPRTIHFVQGTGKPRPQPLEFALAETVAEPVRQAVAIKRKTGVIPASFPAVAVPKAGIAAVGRPPAILRKPTGKQVRIDRFLSLWCARLTSDSNVEANVSRYFYDLKHRSEFRGEGRLRFESPNRIHLKITPQGLKPGEASQRRTPDGKRFTLRGGRPFSIDCDGSQVLLMDPTRGRWLWGAIDPTKPQMVAGTIPLFSAEFSVEPVPLPKLVPIFLGSNDRELKRLFEWRVLRETDSNLWLAATPKTRDGQGWYRRLKVIVNKTNWLPDAVQTIDVTGSFETVYVFRDWKTTTQAVPGK